MRVLAFDTCSPYPSVALASAPDAAASRGRTEKGGEPGLPGETTVLPLEAGAAEALADAVGRLLAAAGLGPRDLDCVAVLTGPGSFTGLRAGLAFARGLARAASVPLAGLPTFAAASRARPDPADADFVLDAGRGEVHRARRRGATLAEDPRPLPRTVAEAEAEESDVPLVDLASPGPPLSPALAVGASLGEGRSDLPPALRYGRPSAAEERFGIPEGNLPGTGQT